MAKPTPSVFTAAAIEIRSRVLQWAVDRDRRWIGQGVTRNPPPPYLIFATSPRPSESATRAILSIKRLIAGLLRFSARALACRAGQMGVRLEQHPVRAPIEDADRTRIVREHEFLDQLPGMIGLARRSSSH